MHLNSPASGDGAGPPRDRERLKKRLHKRDRRIDALTAELGEQANTIRYLRAELDAALGQAGAARDQVGWMSRSLSWRLTLPLRLAYDLRGRMLGRSSGGGTGAPTVAHGVDEAAYLRYVSATALDKNGRKRMSRAAREFGYRPLISVVMPVYNPDAPWLRRAIESVRSQLYDHWELCISDDGSTSAGVGTLLDSYVREDPRIRAVRRDANGGISAASNSALELATGEYIALLDQDDELAPEAFFEVVKALQDERHDILYSDEDKLDARGQRCEVTFKPGYSPDLLFAWNYVSHLGVYRRQMVADLGGFRSAYDGSQDYDLLLRCLDAPRAVHHIPAVLYHWRMSPGSTSVDALSKPSATIAARAAIEDTLRRRGIAGTVSMGFAPTVYDVRREIAGEPLVTIIVPFRDLPEVTRQCVDSVLRTSTYGSFEILLVDNGSVEPATRRFLRSLAGEHRVRVLDDPSPFNYPSINNRAAAEARGDYLLFLNNDTEVIAPGWIEALLEHAQRPEVGAVGAKLLYPDGRIQHGGVVIHSQTLAAHQFAHLSRDHPGYRGQANMVRDVAAVTFACVMVRREVFKELGGLDPALRVAYNDVDFCLRLLEAGYHNIYTPHALLYHHESRSRGREVDARELAYVRRRHAGRLLAGDPNYPSMLDGFGQFTLPAQ